MYVFHIKSDYREWALHEVLACNIRNSSYRTTFDAAYNSCMIFGSESPSPEPTVLDLDLHGVIFKIIWLISPEALESTEEAKIHPDLLHVPYHCVTTLMPTPEKYTLGVDTKEL